MIDARHQQGRPIIIEGIMMLRTLELLGVQPDYYVFVTNERCERATEDDDDDIGPPPGLSGEVDAYLKERQPAEGADWHLVWREPEVRIGRLEGTADIELT